MKRLTMQAMIAAGAFALAAGATPAKAFQLITQPKPHSPPPRPRRSPRAA